MAAFRVFQRKERLELLQVKKMTKNENEGAALYTFAPCSKKK